MRSDETAAMRTAGQPAVPTTSALAVLLTLVAAAVGARAGLLGVGYDTLSDASRVVPVTDYIALSLLVGGTLALLGVIWARHRVALGIGAVFLLYSTITVTLGDQSTPGLIVYWASSAVIFAGLIAAWLRPQRLVDARRLIIDAAIGLVTAVVTFLAIV